MPRLRDVVRAAEELLEQKEVELKHVVAARELLHRKLALLETLVDEQAPVSLLQQLTVRALSLPRRPSVVYADGIGEPSASVPSIAALPEYLVGWDDRLLQRVACMSMADGLQVYRSFLDKAEPLVMHALCHGEASPTHQELCQHTRRYANFLLLHGMVLNPEYERVSKTNLETGQRNSVPAGWYERVGEQLPAHKGLAQLALVAITLARSINHEGLAAFREQVAGNVQTGELVRLNQMLEDYDSTNSEPGYLYRCQVMAYVLMSLLHMPGLPLHEVSMIFCSCWPHMVTGSNILVGYLNRPDVVALLEEESGGGARQRTEGAPPAARRRQVSSAKRGASEGLGQDNQDSESQ